MSLPKVDFKAMMEHLAFEKDKFERKKNLILHIISNIERTPLDKIIKTMCRVKKEEITRKYFIFCQRMSKFSVLNGTYVHSYVQLCVLCTYTWIKGGTMKMECKLKTINDATDLV